ncbi:MAG: YybH family protein [Flavisolibacter sp.]
MKVEEAIYAETEAFRQAWNKGDAKLVTSFFTDNAIRVDGVGSTGATQRGKDELEAAYNRLFNGTTKGIQMKYLDSGEVRNLSPDFVVWQGNLEIIRPDGTSSKGHVLEIFKKVNDRWLIIEAHPKFPSPPVPANSTNQ